MGGREPDGQLQGPRDGGRGRPRRRARRARCRLRLDGQHRRLRRRVRGARRAARGDPDPEGRGRSRKLAQVLPPAPSSARSRATSTNVQSLARRLAEEEGWVNVNSINPDRIEGQASAAREIVAQLGGLPDVLALPYGGGGNTTAYLARVRRRRPRILPVQSGERATTVGSAIRIVEPAASRAGRRCGRDRDGERWRAARVVAGDPAARGAVLRAGLRGRCRRGCAGSARGAGRLRAHRPWAQGSGRGGCRDGRDEPTRTSRLVRRWRDAEGVSAERPRLANLGPGFDSRRLRSTSGTRSRSPRARSVRRTRRTSASARSASSPRPRGRRSSGRTASRARAGSARARRRSRSGWSRRRSGRGRSSSSRTCSLAAGRSRATPTTSPPASPAAHA